MTQHTLNSIEHLVQMYRSSIAVEQNAAIRLELEKEALMAIQKKCVNKLVVLENGKPLESGNSSKGLCNTAIEA